TITYTVEDDTGLTADGVATVAVDTGVIGPETPLLHTDYLSVYQGSSVSFTTTELLGNDADPQSQPLTVVAVSEPSNDGVLTGHVAAGFAYTPSNSPAVVNTDHTLHHLATDTDGPVAQADIIIRILAAGDPNRPAVAGDDVTRTDNGQTVSVFTATNDFDPDRDACAVSRVETPPHGTVESFGNGFNYTPNPGFSGVETITYRIRDDHGLISTGTAIVYVDTGVIGPETPLLHTDYLSVYQGSSVSFTTTELLGNDADPQSQPLTVVAVSEPSTDGVLTGNVAAGSAYTPSNSPAVVNTDHTLHYLATDTDGHVAQADIIIRILAAGDPNRPAVAGDDVTRTDNGQTVSVFTATNDFDPDRDACAVSRVETPPHGTVESFGNGFNYTPNPGFSGVETITYRIRDDHGLISTGTAIVYVDTGVIGPETPLWHTDYLSVYQGSSVSFTTT